MGCKILLIAILLGLSPGTFSQSDVMSKATMKKLCEMPEFQEALANDAELEPAAVVYDVMSKRLETLESHVEGLEKKLDTTPTQQDVEAMAAALKMELIDHVESRMDQLATQLENNVQDILSDLMNNLANLGYEQGFEIQTHPPTTTVAMTTTTEPPTKDCDYLANMKYESGVHALLYNGTEVEGYCEMNKDGHNWLVIQRRIDGRSFYRNWEEYKNGFGDLMSSFYFGNEKIHQITQARDHVLRVEIGDIFGDTGFAEYSNFSLSSEDEYYSLNYEKYIDGNIGDSLGKAKGRQFSTFDMDRDSTSLYSCARLHKGAFWYDGCGSANLNGVYDKQNAYSFNWQNIFWYTWKRDLRPLSAVKMMIRYSQ